MKFHKNFNDLFLTYLSLNPRGAFTNKQPVTPLKGYTDDAIAHKPLHLISRQKAPSHLTNSCRHTVDTGCQTLTPDPALTLWEWPGLWGASSFPQPLVWSHSRLRQLRDGLACQKNPPHTHTHHQQQLKWPFPALFWNPASSNSKQQQCRRDLSTWCRIKQIIEMIRWHFFNV